MSNEILIYEGENKTIEVQLDSQQETLWLSQKKWRSCWIPVQTTLVCT